MVRKPLISSAPWLVPKDLTANWRGLQAGGKGKQRQVVRVAESQLAHLPRPADDAESSVEAAASFHQFLVCSQSTRKSWCVRPGSGTCVASSRTWDPPARTRTSLS